MLSTMGIDQIVLKIPYKETSSALTKELISDFTNEKPDVDSIFFGTNYLTQIGWEVIK